MDFEILELSEISEEIEFLHGAESFIKLSLSTSSSLLERMEQATIIVYFTIKKILSLNLGW